METIIVNTICIHWNTGNIHIREIFLMAFRDADYNIIGIYESIK